MGLQACPAGLGDVGTDLALSIYMAGNMGTVTVVPPDPGVSVEIAKKACAIANGEWRESAGGCAIPDLREIPSWCSFVPFSDFSASCQPLSAAELATLGSYTAYKLAQKEQAAAQLVYNQETGRLQYGGYDPRDPGRREIVTGEEAARQVMETSQRQSQDLVNKAGCEYQTSLEHPTLTAMFGPSIACGLANPFDPDHFGWLMYLGVGAVVLLGGMMLFGGRR